MTLTTRLSAFFLGALAIVLIGFSISLYTLARQYLVGQAEERLLATLDTLTAAVESDAGGLEWEGDERVTVGRDAGLEQPRWEVCEPSGALVRRSANLGGDSLCRGAPGAAPEGAQPQLLVGLRGEPWLVAQRTLRASDRIGPASNEPRDAPPWLAPAKVELQRLYPALVLGAAVSLEPAHATLRTLALALTGLSAVLWLTAALVGRRLCRRALAPVTRMAEAARDMGAADMSQRLPDPYTPGELDELQRAFNGLLDRLEEAFERQRRFTGDASHQLRTPLTAMLGQLDLALRRDRPAEEYRRVLAEVHGQAGRLRQIVEALLFLARADAEAEPRELESIDLATWLAEVCKSWNGHPRAADLRLVVAVAEPVRHQVQPFLLGQLVDNLLENACKYSPAGSPITITLDRQGDSAIVAVEDVGCGIAPEDLPHVFEPFYRAADARRRGLAGTGLGLAVAQRIAAALRGTLAVDSAPGQGSRFTLRLCMVTICPPGNSPTGAGSRGRLLR
jgi:two-component system, OmpR family, sensor kinase